VGAWVYDNFDYMSGVSFFPHSDHVYQQAPYESITSEYYSTRLAAFPSELCFDIVEDEDTTTASQEYACAGGQCEL